MSCVIVLIETFPSLLSKTLYTSRPPWNVTSLFVFNTWITQNTKLYMLYVINIRLVCKVLVQKKTVLSWGLILVLIVNMIVHKNLGKYPRITNARENAEDCHMWFLFKKEGYKAKLVSKAEKENKSEP